MYPDTRGAPRVFYYCGLVSPGSVSLACGCERKRIVSRGNRPGLLRRGVSVTPDMGSQEIGVRVLAKNLIEVTAENIVQDLICRELAHTAQLLEPLGKSIGRSEGNGFWNSFHNCEYCIGIPIHLQENCVYIVLALEYTSKKECDVAGRNRKANGRS